MQDLIDAAKRARSHAQVRHSKFHVGAAIETDDGLIYGGCNVESSSYGLTLCAERVALCKALSEGKIAFRRLAIVTKRSELTPPCGACRQLLWDYCRDIEIILADLKGNNRSIRLATLFPEPFDASFL